MAKHTTHTEPGLGLFRSSGPLIKPTRNKDVDAKTELASTNRDRSIPLESERAKALRLRREAMPLEPNPMVPDIDEGIPLVNSKRADDDAAF